MKKHLLLLAGLLSFGILPPAYARTQNFRSGTILAAEISTTKPPFTFEEPLRSPADFSKSAYAAVVISLDKGRKLSIYDYSLESFGSRFPCIAIRVGNDPVDMHVTDIAAPSAFIRYTLIFAVDATLVGGRSGGCRFRLVPTAPPASSAVEVEFSLLGKSAFTPPGDISGKGILKDKK